MMTMDRLGRLAEAVIYCWQARVRRWVQAVAVISRRCRASPGSGPVIPSEVIYRPEIVTTRLIICLEFQIMYLLYIY